MSNALDGVSTHTLDRMVLEGAAQHDKNLGALARVILAADEGEHLARRDCATIEWHPANTDTLVAEFGGDV